MVTVSGVENDAHLETKFKY
jgi:hypothetical protein